MTTFHVFVSSTYADGCVLTTILLTTTLILDHHLKLSGYSDH